MAKKLLIAAGALAVAVAAGAAWAHGPGRGRMMGHMLSQRIADLEDFIDATPQQRAVIEQAKNDIVNVIQSHAQDRRAAHQQFAQLLAADQLSEAQINAFVAQKTQAFQDALKQIAPDIVKVHDALTPAQRQKLFQRFQERQQRRDEEKGGFGGQ